MDFFREPAQPAVRVAHQPKAAWLKVGVRLRARFGMLWVLAEKNFLDVARRMIVPIDANGRKADPAGDFSQCKIFRGRDLRRDQWKTGHAADTALLSWLPRFASCSLGFAALEIDQPLNGK